jgi:uncharacterized delta-60 repeat protein
MILILTCVAESQVTEEWVRRYDGTGNGTDEGHAIAVDTVGNVYVTGASVDGNNFDYVTIKYNSSGVQQWLARYNGPANGSDVANAIKADTQGNVYVTGWSSPTQFGTNYDYATVKYNSSGLQQWAARYNSPDNLQDKAVALGVDGLGNVYVTGVIQSITSGFDLATIKYDAAGVQQWVQIYSGPAGSPFTDEARALALDGQGNVFVTGRSDSAGRDIVTIKYSPAGAPQWEARFNTLNGQLNSNDEPYAIAIDSQGSVCVTGYTQPTQTLAKYATIKYSPLGILEWAQTFTGPDTIVGINFANAIAIDNLGNTYVTGQSGLDGSVADYATIKYTSNGDRVWAAVYNGTGNLADNPHAITVDAQGNVYVVGESWGNNPNYPNYDCVTIRYNSLGAQDWVARYDGPGSVNDYGYAIAVDNQGRVYVTGQSNQAQTGSNFDYVTIKYSQPTGVSEPQLDVPSRIALHQNYPNPFNPSTSIAFELARQSQVSLKIYSIIGEEVATLANETLEAGRHERRLNATHLASGVYLFRLTTDEATLSRKLVLTK